VARRGRLTEEFAKAAKPGFHRDHALAGFGLLVGARTKAWQLRIERKAASKVFLTLGHFPDMSAAKARAEAHESLAKYEKKEPLRAPPGEPTLDSTLELYCEYLDDENRSPSTKQWYKQSIGRLSEGIRFTPLRELGLKPILMVDEVDRIRRRWRGKSSRGGQSAATSSARAVSTLFKYAQNRDPTIIGNPTSGARKADPKRHDLPVLGADDMAEWWAKVEKVPNEVKRWALLFTVLSGLRRSTVVAIEWRHVDFRRRCARIEKPKGGTGRAFDLILSRPMLRVLWQARRASRKLYHENAKTFVFAGPKGHMRGDALNREEVEANHALRRTFGTLATEAGFAKETVGVLLGHGEHSVTQRYIRTSKLGAFYGAAQEDISRHIIKTMGNPKELR